MAKRKYLPFSYLQILLFTWKDQGNINGPGIYCGGHFTVTYGGELHLQIFLRSCPPSNFVMLELPFLHGFKSRTHVYYPMVNHTETIICADRAE